MHRFLQQLEADGRSPHTIAQYRRHVRLLAKWAQGRSLEKLTHEDLAAFLASPVARTRPDGGVKRASSMNCLRASLRAFYGYLLRAGRLPTNPARLIRSALCSPPPPRGLTEDQEQKLMEELASARPRDNALFHLMLATGLRVGSVCALEARDVDLERGEVHLREAKRGQRDRVLLGQEIREHLCRYMEGKSGRLFDVTPRHVSRLLKKYAGPDVSPHMLRHTFAERIYRKTRDVLVVKEALRHRSVTSTMVYARPSEEAVRAVL